MEILGSLLSSVTSFKEWEERESTKESGCIGNYQVQATLMHNFWTNKAFQKIHNYEKRHKRRFWKKK